MVKWIIFGVIFVSYYAWDYYSESKRAKNGFKKKAKDIVSGPEQWKVAQLEWKLDKQKTDARIKELGLDTRYTTLSLGGNVRTLLYTNQDFDAVEEKLGRRFAGASEPMKAYHYSSLVNDLGEFSFAESPDHFLQVLNAWVAAKPDSYRALLVRGHFYIKYAWYFRGTDWAVNMLGSDTEQFKEYLNFATSDLETAQQMNPEDAESSSGLIIAAGALIATQPKISAYYKQAMTANPLHNQARANYLNFLQPKWGGTMKQVMELAKEIEKTSGQFPLLLLTVRNAHIIAVEDEAISEEEWDGIRMHPKWVDACIEQHERCPDDPYIMNMVAINAHYTHEYDRAIEYFEKIGDRYLEGEMCDSLLDYHESRTYAYAASAFYTNNFNTNKGEIYAEKAVALMPDDPFCNNVYGNIMLDRNRLIEARKHFMKALEADPTYATVMCSLAYASFAEDDFEEATSWAKQGLALTGDAKMKEDLKKIILESKKGV